MLSPSITGTFSESGSFSYLMLKRALDTLHVRLPECTVPWILHIFKARKSVLRPRSFSSPNMLQNFGSLIAISKCIFFRLKKRIALSSKRRFYDQEQSSNPSDDRLSSGRHKGDSTSLLRTSSAIGVNVAAEDDDVSSLAWLISSSEEEGA